MDMAQSGPGRHDRRGVSLVEIMRHGRKKNRPLSERRLERRGVAGKVAVGAILDRPTNQITATVLADTKVRTIQSCVRPGVHPQMRAKSLGRYVGDFAGRHNLPEADTTDQMEAIASGFLGKRRRYAELTA